MNPENFYRRLDQSGHYKTRIVKKNFLRRFPGGLALWFYFRIFQTVFGSYFSVKTNNEYSLKDLKFHAYLAILAVEEVGGTVEFLGLENVKNLDRPAIFIGNHMSSLETFILTAILLHYTPVTFVLKASLFRYPIFGKILKVLEPVQVERKDPRGDLKVVLEKGSQTLQNGKSIILFPQQTRTTTLEKGAFNSLGVKLARRANAPMVPVAIKTDFWGNGKYVKDLGRIKINEQVIIEFGEPLYITGRGKEEHDKIFEFIKNRVSSWQNNCKGSET